MPAAVRNVLSVVAGIAVSIVVVVLADFIVGTLTPLPHALDPNDPEAARAAIAAVPIPALLGLVVGWGMAAGIGAFVGARLSARRTRTFGAVVAGVLLAATITNLTLIPHPGWMWLAALALIPLLGWLGARAGALPRNHPMAPA